MPSSAILFLGSDAQGFHLPVEMAALQTQEFGRARDVPPGFFEFLEDEVALIRLAGFVQGRELIGTPRSLYATIASRILPRPLRSRLFYFSNLIHSDQIYPTRSLLRNRRGLQGQTPGALLLQFIGLVS